VNSARRRLTAGAMCSDRTMASRLAASTSMHRLHESGHGQRVQQHRDSVRDAFDAGERLPAARLGPGELDEMSGAVSVELQHLRERVEHLNRRVVVPAALQTQVVVGGEEPWFFVPSAPVA
jgi:hypothetical protein